MTRFLISIICAISLALPAPDAFARKPETNSSVRTQTKKNKNSTQKKPSPSVGQQKKTATKGKTKSPAKTNKSKKPESSAEVKKREQEANREIKKTQTEIAANDKAVKTGLAQLGRLSSQIEVTRTQVKDISSQVKGLDSKITILQSQISEGENSLEKMRSKYLDAVRKMRAKKGNQSALAFIFSSKSISQAMRRMRYLKDFSQWRDTQSRLIEKKVKDLKYQTQLLAQTQNEKRTALNQQLQAQKTLEQQHSQQDAVVADLKKNGEALRAHLARKQAEVNQLRNRVAALIAQEQVAEARRQEKLRAEAEAKAAREREQRLAKQRDEQQRKEREKQEEIKNNRQKNNGENLQAENVTPKKADNKKADTKKGSSSSSTPKAKSSNQNSGAEYAEARKRRPRGEKSQPAVSKVEKVEKAEKTYGNFEAAKGSLPRPVSGSFRVTSPFGRHPLPDLPEVIYDNPGIDAQVDRGASARAVFPGRVSGVYILPGYNTVVIINHGNYYTIYGNLASANVKVGDSVKQGHTIGKVATDPDTPDHSLLHFELWKNREKQNPMAWIK